MHTRLQRGGVELEDIGCDVEPPLPVGVRLAGTRAARVDVAERGVAQREHARHHGKEPVHVALAELELAERLVHLPEVRHVVDGAHPGAPPQDDVLGRVQLELELAAHVRGRPCDELVEDCGAV